jgi:uncharacterized metal-binding protein YceD (DUF177 family)
MNEDFAYRLPLDRIRDGERVDLSAEQSERRAIADRLGVPAIERLEAHAVLKRAGDAILAEGRVAARLEQSCVVTGEPVAAHVDEPFTLAFVPVPRGAAPDEEIELSQSDCDTMFHDGSAIDLGAAITDTLALALDPYPRSAGAEAALKEAGVMSEEQAGPFAMLAQLKGKESQ